MLNRAFRFAANNAITETGSVVLGSTGRFGFSLEWTPTSEVAFDAGNWTVTAP